MDIDHIATDIFVSDLENPPIIDYTRRTPLNRKYPFLRRASFIIPHKEAMEIINDLRTFYDVYSEQDIKDINNRFLEILEETA